MDISSGVAIPTQEVSKGENLKVSDRQGRIEERACLANDSRSALYRFVTAETLEPWKEVNLPPGRER